MMENSTLEAIRKRRSIRVFEKKTVPEKQVKKILDAGRWAPSGLNNQPWRFRVIREDGLKNGLAGMTRYGDVIAEADLCIAVFFYLPSGYNRDKDLMGIGACIQNMLLAAHSLGLGAVWLGEILIRKGEVNELLTLGPEYELIALCALGYPAERPEGVRKELADLIV